MDAGTFSKITLSMATGGYDDLPPKAMKSAEERGREALATALIRRLPAMPFEALAVWEAMSEDVERLIGELNAMTDEEAAKWVKDFAEC